MANAKAEEETRCIRLPSRLEGGQQVCDRFRLPSFPADQLLPFVVQAEDIGRTFQPAQFEKFLNALFAQALYVHCPTADKMDQPLHPLSVADEAPGAAIVYLPLFPHGFRPARSEERRVGKECVRT